MSASIFAPPRDLLDYQPERVALTGYRCAMAGYEFGDASSWDALWDALANDGGLHCACHVMGSLQFFVRSLRSTLEGAGNYYPQNCRRVCRVEGLVLALLAAHQNSDDLTRAFTMQHLLGELAPVHGELIDAAAAAWARAMRDCDLCLMPVPLDVVQSIVSCGRCQLNNRSRLDA